MEFNHLHLYVDDVAYWRDCLGERWGGHSRGVPGPLADHMALVCLGPIPLLMSKPHWPGDTVATYLGQHPPGIGDIAFWVPDLDRALARLIAQGGYPLTPVRWDGGGRWCQVQGWGDLRHTLVQSDRPMAWVPGVGAVDPQPYASCLSHIDHSVLNVPAGQMGTAVAWYAQRFGFQARQRFAIHTPWSGLHSQVLVSPEGRATLPINEPATANSQIQEFLDWNRGPGVQHVALHTDDIIQTVQSLKALGIKFLAVPEGYYQALAQRPGYGAVADPVPSSVARLPSEWGPPRATLADLTQLQILVDWDDQTPQAKLLQTFTQPVFGIPTLFFEIIQRQTLWVEDHLILAQGFGERNFQALFEAMEQEQRQREGWP